MCKHISPKAEQPKMSRGPSTLYVLLFQDEMNMEVKSKYLVSFKESSITNKLKSTYKITPFNILKLNLIFLCFWFL